MDSVEKVVSVPRKLFEDASSCSEWTRDFALAEIGRLVLEAKDDTDEAFEQLRDDRDQWRQMVGEVVAVVSKGMSGYDGVLYADAIIEGVVEAGTKLYTAPPELAELQATIDELAELLKQAREHVPQAHPLRGLINASLMQHQLERGPKQ